MIGFTSLTILELRKRFDTRGAVVGWLSLTGLIIGSGGLSVIIMVRTQEFGVGEVIVTTGLIPALASSIIGVVLGVGDPDGGNERDAVLAGLPRRSAFAARAVACALIMVSLVIVTVAIALVAAGSAAVLGGAATPSGWASSIGQLLALTMASGALGFGFGAAVRSLALGLVGVLLVVLVVDTALSFVGPWGEYVRFSTVQAALTGSAPVLPMMTSGMLWIIVPLVLGWYRSARATC